MPNEVARDVPSMSDCCMQEKLDRDRLSTKGDENGNVTDFAYIKF
jgi:hypothetical protein